MLNGEQQVDIDRILNGTLHEMKVALQQWQTNMKKVEYLDLMVSV